MIDSITLTDFAESLLDLHKDEAARIAKKRDFNVIFFYGEVTLTAQQKSELESDDLLIVLDSSDLVQEVVTTQT